MIFLQYFHTFYHISLTFLNRNISFSLLFLQLFHNLYVRCYHFDLFYISSSATKGICVSSSICPICVIRVICGRGDIPWSCRNIWFRVNAIDSSVSSRFDGFSSHSQTVMQCHPIAANFRCSSLSRSWMSVTCILC